MKQVSVRTSVAIVMAGLGCVGQSFAADKASVAPAKMAKIATVDERFQSYNVEMVEVTGGRFWAPYKQKNNVADTAANPKFTGPGLDPSLYRYRPPIDLTNHRLRTLAAALGPAYVRVSGTWANSTFFQDDSEPARKTPPEGFGGVLTRQEWKGVIDFVKAVDGKLVSSFAISAGVRDADGLWTPVEAKKLLTYTASIGGSIFAAEFTNEPNFGARGGAPKDYDAAAYGRDFKAFLPFIRQAAPRMVVLGPGSLGEESSLVAMSSVKTTDMLTAAGPGVDGFSYHFYGGVSKRCSALAGRPVVTPETALSDTWLSGTEKGAIYYASLRDRFEPGKPMWLTETGETACGGDPWAATFVDSFRYLNQLGALAKLNVQAVMHNTLAASDYALIDEDTLEPRPNYWSALLWRKFMGATVLEAAAPPVTDLHVYAHCLREVAGGVAMLVINANTGAERSLEVDSRSERYTLTARELMGSTVDLNGKPLQMEPHDVLPNLIGKSLRPGEVRFAPQSITFLAMPKAGNVACR